MKRSIFKVVGDVSLVVAVAVGLATTAGCGNLSEPGAIAVAYAPNGGIMAFLDGEVRFFDADAQHPLGSMATTPQTGGGWIPFPPRYVASADGATIAIGANLTVQIYGVDTRTNVASIVVSDDMKEPGPIAGVALSPQGDLVAVAVRPIDLATTGRLAIWRVADQTLVAEIAAPADQPMWQWSAGLAFSPDATALYGAGSSYLTTSTPSGKTTSLSKTFVLALNTTTGTALWQTEVPVVMDGPVGGEVGALALSADGTSLATAGQTIRRWRTSDGASLPFDNDPSPVPFGSVAISPDGQDVVAARATNQVPDDPEVVGPDGAAVWSAPIAPGQSGCEMAIFSPDGARVAATCSQGLTIWDAKTGAQIQQIKVNVKLY